MHDEDLREEFAAWLRPVREAHPPGLPALRRRLRRRQARQAIGGTAALVAVAGLAVVVSTTLGAPPAPAGPSAPAGAPGSTGAPGATGASGSGGILNLSSNIPVTTSGPRPVKGGYQVSSTYTVSAPVSALKVYGGTITVTGSQRASVSVSEHVRYFASGRKPVMTRNLTGRTMTLAYECSGDPLCVVSYAIQVPRGLAVSVQTSSGDIRLSALAGDVTASAGSGDISADGLSSPEASFVSDSGDIGASFTAAPMMVHAAGAAGDIAISVPSTVSYQVNIKPGNGDTAVSVPQSSTSRHVIDASSNEGDVAVGPSS